MIRNLSPRPIGVLGDNIIFQGRNATAYYMFPLFSYSIMSPESSESHINKMKSAMQSVKKNFKSITFSIFKVSQVFSVDTKIKNLVKTSMIWDKFYNIPDILRDSIKQEVVDYAIVSVDLTRANDIQMADSIGEMLKDYAAKFAEEYLMGAKAGINVKRTLAAETVVREVLDRYAQPVNRSVLLNIYAKMVYPSYDLDTELIRPDELETFLPVISQEFTPHFGWFELSNSGAELFNAESVPSYSSVFNISHIPPETLAGDLDLDYPGMRVVFEILDIQEARLMLQKSRADIDYEIQMAETADANISDLELQDNADLTEFALEKLKAGETLCRMNLYALVSSLDKTKLRQKKRNLVSWLHDLDITARTSIDQVGDYYNTYLCSSTPKKWDHLCDLAFPLALQLDAGTNLGDFDSKYAAVTIGDDLAELDK